MKHYRIAFLLLLSTLILGGCNIKITVPQGGSVTTASGTINCAAGKTCNVSVVDLFFDETFQAIPADGYIFAGWNTRQRGFCGGDTGHCRLFTSGFEGNPSLMAFLDNANEVFYLEPVFEQSNLAGGSATACFNAEIVSPGTQVESSYRSTDGESNAIINFSYSQLISGDHTFNGNAAIRSRAEVVATGAAPSTSRTDAFFSVDEAKSRLMEYGIETNVTSPQSTQLKVTFAPHILTRLDLNAGQSYSHDWSQTENTMVAGISLETTRAMTRRSTYLGRETIEVPAGRFETCVIRSDDTSPDGSSTATTWFGVGNGMLIKEDAQGDITVLISATINGQAL